MVPRPELPDDRPDDHKSYRQQMDEHRAQRDAERAELERDLALKRTRERGRDDLAELLEAGQISAARKALTSTGCNAGSRGCGAHSGDGNVDGDGNRCGRNGTPTPTSGSSRTAASRLGR